MSRRMDLTSKLYQPFVLNKIEKTNWVEGTDAPLVVELDTTEACDLACPGCISQDIMQTQNRFSDERLLQIGQEFYEAGVKAVVLIGGGEPLAHPAVGDLMTYLGEHDIHIGITTNGTFIRKYLDIIAEYSSWTRVSMDAGSSDLFNQLRPAKSGKGSRFPFIIENMEMLAKIKKGKMGYSYLIQTEADGAGVVSNVHEIYSAARLAREIGCDYFEVKPSYQFRDDVEHALMRHDQGLMDQAKEEIAKLDELETDSFKIIHAINLQYSLENCDPVQMKSYKKCPATELRTLVCPSGAFVCPYWRGKEHMKIGDLVDTSFQDVWHGEQRKKTMERLDASRDCYFYCLRHPSNEAVIDIAKRFENGEDVYADQVEEFDRFI